MESLMPTIDDEWKKPPMARHEELFMTQLGIVAAQVLIYLDEHGATALHRLTKDLEWSAALTALAVGGLIRERLVRALPVEHELMVEPVGGSLRQESAAVERRAPEVWGG